MAGKSALLMMCGAVMVWMAEGAIDCGTVKSDLQPCINYLTTGTGVPSSDCCAGVRSLAAAATTTTDRRAACSCLQQASGTVPGVMGNAVSSLPGACKVKLPFPVTSSTNCNTIE